MTDAQTRAIQWLSNGETGMSSKTLCFMLAFGVKMEDSSHPYDPADFNRCLQFLSIVPEARPHLHLMRDVSPSWARIVDNWDRIERSFLDEAGIGWTKARKAPLTYALMNTLRKPEPPHD